MSSVVRHSRRAGPLAAVLLASTSLTSPGALAQTTGTWLANPPTQYLVEGGNWSSGGTVSPGNAIFGASSTTSLALTSTNAVWGFNSLQFSAGAPAYTVTLDGSGNTRILFLSGPGIIDNSANAPTFIVTGNTGSLFFQNSATAADATLSAGNGGRVTFLDTSSGGTARLIADAGGTIAFNLSSAGTTAGSIEGAGSFILNDKQLTVGGNNLSTTVSGVISGDGGSLVKEGTGTLTLSGANTYTGGTTVNAGTLQLGASNALATNGALQVNGGTFDLNGNNQTVGALSGSGGTIALGGGTLTAGDSSNTALATAITGAGSLVKQGTGTLALSGSNSYSGGTSINAGTLAIDNGSALGTGGVTFNGGTLLGTADLTLGNDLTIGTGQTGTVAAAANTTLSFSPSNFNLDGTAVFGSATNTGTVLFGARSGAFTPNTVSIVVAGGTLKAGNNALGSLTGGISSTMVDAGATLDFNGNYAAINNLQGGGTVANGGQTLTLNGGDFSGAITGSGALVKNTSGTLTLSGSSTYGGGTSVSGGTLAINNGQALGTGGVSLNGGTLLGTADLTLGNNVTIGTGQTGTVAAAANTTLSFSPNNFTLLGTAVFGSTADTGTVVIAQPTGQAWTYAPATASIVVAGGTLKAGNGGLSLLTGSISSTTVDAGATLDFNGYTAAINNLQGGGTVANGGQTLTLNSGNFSGSIVGSGDLVKRGNGTLTLSGVNAYTGGTTVNGGTLQLGTGGALAAGGALQVNGGTFDLNGNNQTVGALSGSGGTITLGGGTLTAGDSSNTALATAITGAGSLVKQGTGTLALSGSSTYSGGTSINAGTLAINNGSALGSGGVSLNGGTLLGTADLTLGNDVTIGAGQTGTVAAAAGTTLSFSPNSIGLYGTAVFGSTADTGTVVVSVGTAWSYSGAASIMVAGGTLKAGDGSLGFLTGGTSSTTVDAGATLDFNGNYAAINNLQGGGTVANGGQTLTLNGGDFSGSIVGSGDLVKRGNGTLTLSGSSTYGGGTSVSGGTLEVANNSALGSGAVTVDNSANQAATLKVDSGIAIGNHIFLNNGGTLDNAGSISFTAAGQWAVESTAGQATASNTGTIQGGIGGVDLRAGGTIINQGGTITATDTQSYGVIIQGTTGSVTNSNGGTITAGWVGAALYAGGTIANQGGTIAGTDSNSVGAFILGTTGSITNTGGGTIRGVETGVVLGAGGTVTNGAASTIQGGLSAVQVDGGSATLNNAGTIIGNVDLDRSRNDPANQVTLFSGSSIQGDLYVGANAASTLTLDGTGTQAYSQAVTGATTFAGQLTKRGTGTWIVDTTVSAGNTTVEAGGLIVNGRLGSAVTVDSGGMLGGSGIVTRDVTNNGILSPGNSIGTLTVNGNYSQGAGGTYQVEVNAAGQSDRLNVGGTATLGGTVQVLAAPGTYARNTTYTILNAGSLSGTYSGITSNFAFLTPTLGYDANNVFLTLLQSQSAFASGGQTANQKAVGGALDRASASATGDFNTVLNALASLSTTQGPAALDAISGQPYANFGTANLQSGLSFMNTIGQQISGGRGGGAGATRVALTGARGETGAEACETVCDIDPSRWSAWLSGIAGTGSVAGTADASGLTYNFGGTAVGVDYRFDPRFLVGLSIGYTTGTLWTNGSDSRATTNNYGAALYGSFQDGGFYTDALAGYAYADNQMRRTIAIPGLAPRTAYGAAGANQLLGQIESGYTIELGGVMAAAVTPFARLQATSSLQNGFTETGADSLNLSMAPQTTTALRTTLGAQLNGTIEKVALALRLGWMHEHADTARPTTAAFAGAAGSPFTIYGVSPQRDQAAIGFSANAAIADATSIYIRYDGEVGGGSDNHALSAGLRLTW